MRYVVAIAYVTEFEALQALPVLDDREDVRHCLARMLEVGEPVDHRNRRMGGKRLADIVAESADHDPVHHPFEVLGHVKHRFAFAEINVGGGQKQ